MDVLSGLVLAIFYTFGYLNLNTCLGFAKDKEFGILSGIVCLFLKWKTYKKAVHRFICDSTVSHLLHTECKLSLSAVMVQHSIDCVS